MRGIRAEKLAGAVAFLAALAMVAFRLWGYGDLRLSIGHGDTPSYIESSRSDVWSWQIFAGKRLFTTNIFYKLANSETDCPLHAVSTPAEGAEGPRKLQPCFTRITFVQNVLSAASWTIAAWVFSRRLQILPYRIVSALLILTFGFTPQIAEWDFILGPESLTISLFVLASALLAELVFKFTEDPQALSSPVTRLLFAAWALTFLLWVFVRDVHIYAVPVTIMLVAALFLPSRLRRPALAAGIIVPLALVFMVGNRSARDSLRATHYPLTHAFQDFIFGYPERVEFMKNLGMPDPTSPEFEAWFDANATGVYGLFLATHPQFVATTLWEATVYFSMDFEQPYFTDSKSSTRDALLRIGEFVHPQTLAVYLLDALLLAGFWIKAFLARTPETISWCWFSTWLLLSATAILLPAFFGDTVGTQRHVFAAVEFFRFFIWIGLLAQLDQGQRRAESQPPTAITAPAAG